MLDIFDPKKYKPKPMAEDPAFSEDVCLIDEEGLIGVVCFAFKEDRWLFHFDTLVDYENEDVAIKWKWYYPPVVSKDIEW